MTDMPSVAPAPSSCAASTSPCGDGTTQDSSRKRVSSIALPKQLGPYRILGRLGRGGMNHVLRAVHLGLQREVALKVLPPQHAAKKTKLARFKREARLAAAVSHPALMTCFDAGCDQEWWYMACELMPRGDLRQATRQRQQPWGEIAALRLLAPIAEGLHELHEAGIIHRDVKLSNVLLTDRGTAQLTDFGIAISQHQQQAGEVVGSAAYMAPEAMRGKVVTAAVDVYALGVCLFELLTGELPFQRSGTAIRRGEIDQQAAPSVRCFQPHLSREVDVLLQRALEPNPARRFATAAVMARAMTAIMHPEQEMLTAVDFAQVF